MSIPETPSDTGYFKPQHGYETINVKTHKYSGDPTPISPHQGKAAEFFQNQTDKDHQKKYAKEGGKRLFNFLVKSFCN